MRLANVVDIPAVVRVDGIDGRQWIEVIEWINVWISAARTGGKLRGSQDMKGASKVSECRVVLHRSSPGHHLASGRLRNKHSESCDGVVPNSLCGTVKM